MRKPRDLKMKEYMARVEELNNYLEYFPGYEEERKLHSDELLEIFQHGVPNSWQKTMLIHDFDPIERSKVEFREFCERLETAEEIHYEQFKGSSGAKPKAGRADGYYQNGSATHSAKVKKSHKKKQSGARAQRYVCAYHGENNSHDTNSCKVVLEQAKRMRAQRNSSNQGQGQGTRSNWKNRDWSKGKRTESSHCQQAARARTDNAQDEYMSDDANDTLDIENFNYEDALFENEAALNEDSNHMDSE